MGDLSDWEGPLPHIRVGDEGVVDLYAERNGRLLLVPRAEKRAYVVPEPVPFEAFAGHAELLTQNGSKAWPGEVIDLEVAALT